MSLLLRLNAVAAFNSRRSMARPLSLAPVASHVPASGAHAAPAAEPDLCACPCARQTDHHQNVSRAVSVSSYPDRGRRACDKPRSRSPSSASGWKQALTLKTLTPDLSTATGRRKQRSTS